MRSTFIVGFPGETEAEFEQLLDFLDAAQLDRVGCFTYSPVDGAAANALPDPVPEEIKQERHARFMARQERISRSKLACKVGRALTVLVDRIENGMALARSSADAPDIDGVVHLENGTDVRPGELCQVRIERADAHDMWAMPTGVLADPALRTP